MAKNKKNTVKAASVKQKSKKVTVKTVVKKSTNKPAASKAIVKPVAKKQAAKKAPVKKIAIKKSATSKNNTKKAVKKAAPKKAVTVVKKAIVKKPVDKKPLEIVKQKPSPKSKLPVVKKAEVALSTEKIVKVGVKTKKQLVVVIPLPVIEVSNFPKNKVKTILISQPKPENDKNPYYDLSKKYNLIETFRQFIKIEGIPVKDFRSQRIDILEHKAVILTSRMAVDHYFRMCNEMRVTVPESMKYFCINEATAYYLQKYIQYRKRKIFFGHQTIQDLVDVIRKNREEKFLLPASDVHKEQICDFLDAINIKYTKAIIYRCSYI